MTYEEALDNVYGRLVFGIKPGLERISALLDRLGAPQKQLKFVHVAGTNGKGTCSTLVASALQACGLKVGLYTSPYVLDFRERFQINGEMIPKEELVQEVEVLAPVADEFEKNGDQVTEFGPSLVRPAPVRHCGAGGGHGRPVRRHQRHPRAGGGSHHVHFPGPHCHSGGYPGEDRL